MSNSKSSTFSPSGYWPTTKLEKAAYERSQAEVTERKRAAAAVLETITKLSSEAMQNVPVVLLAIEVGRNHAGIGDFETRIALSALAKDDLVIRDQARDFVSLPPIVPTQ